MTHQDVSRALTADDVSAWRVRFSDTVSGLHAIVQIHRDSATRGSVHASLWGVQSLRCSANETDLELVVSERRVSCGSVTIVVEPGGDWHVDFAAQGVIGNFVFSSASSPVFLDDINSSFHESGVVTGTIVKDEMHVALECGGSREVLTDTSQLFGTEQGFSAWSSTSPQDFSCVGFASDTDSSTSFAQLIEAGCSSTPQFVEALITPAYNGGPPLRCEIAWEPGENEIRRDRLRMVHVAWLRHVAPRDGSNSWGIAFSGYLTSGGPTECLVHFDAWVTDGTASRAHLVGVA